MDNTFAETPLQITLVCDVGSTRRVRLEGELDETNAHELVAFVAGRSITGVVMLLDVAGLTFVSSAGLRALLAAHRALEAGGGRLILEQASPLLLRLLGITGIDGAIDVRPQRPT